MINKFSYQGITWIDIEKPEKNELATLASEYNLHPIIIGELENPNSRSHVDVYGNIIYTTLHFPIIKSSYESNETSSTGQDSQEIDFILGPNFVITGRYEHNEAIKQVEKAIDAQVSIAGKQEKIHAGLLFYFIIRELYQSLEANLDYLNSSLKRSEKGIFAGEEIKTVKLLSDINRNLIDFKWSLKHHHEVLSTLEAAGRNLYGEKFEYYMRSIGGEFEKIWSTLESHRETFMDLRRTNDSLLAIKTSEATKTLTAIAFFTFTLSTLAAIFGMNMKHNPFNNFPYDFWVMIAIMGVITIGIFISFRKRKWL